jgi:hypothetical protein
MCILRSIIQPDSAKALQQRPDPSLRLRIGRGKRKKYTDTAHPLALLRTRDKRPRRRRTTKKTNKLPSPHVRPQKIRTVKEQPILTVWWGLELT